MNEWMILFPCEVLHTRQLKEAWPAASASEVTTLRRYRNRTIIIIIIIIYYYYYKTCGRKY